MVRSIFSLDGCKVNIYFKNVQNGLLRTNRHGVSLRLRRSFIFFQTLLLLIRYRLSRAKRKGLG